MSEIRDVLTCTVLECKGLSKDFQSVIYWMRDQNSVHIEEIIKQLDTSVQQGGFKSSNRAMFIRLYLWVWNKLEQKDDQIYRRILSKISKLIRRAAKNRASKEEEAEYQKVQEINDMKKIHQVISELKGMLRVEEEFQSNIASIKKKFLQSEEDVEYVAVLNDKLEVAKQTTSMLNSKYNRLKDRLSWRNKIIVELALQGMVSEGDISMEGNIMVVDKQNVP
jgi:hypothetical protein